MKTCEKFELLKIIKFLPPRSPARIQDTEEHYRESL